MMGKLPSEAAMAAAYDRLAKTDEQGRTMADMSEVIKLARELDK